MSSRRPEQAGNTFLEYVLDQLRLVPQLRSKRMFGAFGIYSGDTFFAIVDDGRLYFRTSLDSCHRYIEMGMPFFQPNPKQSIKRYYEVPPAVLDDPAELANWARTSISCGSAVQAKKGSRRWSTID